MTITLPSDLETALAEQARQQGTTPETLALEALREKFALKELQQSPSLQAQDIWEATLLSVGTDCGVSLSHEAVSSEGLYD
jgi:predicted transcriptional regulator